MKVSLTKSCRKSWKTPGIEDPVILAEDRHFIGVYKPSRLLTTGDSTGDFSLLDWVRREVGRPFVAPIHFLDRPVSGVVLFALSSKGASRISEQFRQRSIEKFYLAMVDGPIENGQDTLEDWLIKDHRTNLVKVGSKGDKDAKFCRLSYAVVARFGLRSLIRISLETGRSHQIRVQLSFRGLHIIGDTKYGGQSQWLGGALSLHAYQVNLLHPVTKELQTIIAPCPKEWSHIWPGPWPHQIAIGDQTKNV